jgi:hypothetical protein
VPAPTIRRHNIEPRFNFGRIAPVGGHKIEDYVSGVAGVSFDRTDQVLILDAPD